MIYNVLFLDIIGHNIEQTMRLAYPIGKNDYLIHQLFLVLQLKEVTSSAKIKYIHDENWQ